MNASRIVVKEDNLAISVPYSPVTFGLGMKKIMFDFHRLPANLKFLIVMDHDEVYYQCAQISPEAPPQKFSIRIMNALLLFIQNFDADFFSNVMQGLTFLFETKHYVNGWYFKTQMAHDLQKNERGQFRFYSNWKFNTFVLTNFETYEKFKSFLHLSKPPICDGLENDNKHEYFNGKAQFHSVGLRGNTATIIQDNSGNEEMTDEELPELI